MIRSSLFLSATVLAIVLLCLMDRLQFLASWKKDLFFHCGTSIAAFVGVLGLNLFAAILAINRKLFLKDTGRKLSHLDNQLHSGGSEVVPPFLLENR